jgi:hypothetical protein
VVTTPTKDLWYESKDSRDMLNGLLSSLRLLLCVYVDIELVDTDFLQKLGFDIGDGDKNVPQPSITISL